MTYETFRRYRLDFLVTALLSLVIVVLTLMPHVPGPEIPTGDKIEHFLAFGALVIPIGLLRRPLLFWVALYSVSLGALIELIQPYTGRSGDILDFMADAAGVAVAVLIIFALNAILAPRRA